MGEQPASHNEFGGQARVVIQAGHVGGDINIPLPDRPAKPQRQVPPPTRHYVNNERPLAEITAAVGRGDGPRVVVIQGPPGSGKTELAFQWVADQHDDYPDGQFYVPLSGGADESGAVTGALRQILTVVGYDPAKLPDSLAALSAWFRGWSAGKRVVVVVDGARTPAQVRPLLPGTGDSAVLVTDAGRLAGLSAREGAAFVELDPMSDAAAHQLLGSIAGEDRLAAEPDAAAELVRVCGGSTIALCVTGALLAEFPERSVSRLARELSREGRRLRALSSDDELSVRTVLNTAFDRLDEDAQRCYVAFGQHPGTAPTGVPALAAALGDDDDDVRDVLDRLVTRRLVREDAAGRYAMTNELERDHARERAADVPGAERMAQRFAAYYRQHALAAGQAMSPDRGWFERLWPELRFTVSFTAAEARAWLEAERLNLRALAESWHRAATPQEDLCRLAVALWPLHERGKYLDDLDVVNEQAAEVAEHLGATQVLGVLLTQRGFAFRLRGELDKAAELFSRACDLGGEHDHREVEGTALESLGLVRREQGQVDEARTLLRRNLGFAREIGEDRRVAMACLHLGSVAEPGEALELLAEAERRFRELSSEDVNLAKVSLWRGRTLVVLGRHAEAETDLTGALESFTSGHHHYDVAQTLRALAELAAARGDDQAAQRHLTEALELCRTRGFTDLAERIRSPHGPTAGPA